MDMSSNMITNHGLATDIDSHRIEALRKSIDEYYEKIPYVLRNSPESQEKCLKYLFEAEKGLDSPNPRSGIIQSRMDVTRVEIEISRARSARISFSIVVLIIYMFAVVAGTAWHFNVLPLGIDGKQLNAQLVLGIPLTIVIWSVIGSFTSMLLRAGQMPFSNPQEALRWLLFRPIVGVVMGILTYLMVTSGLLVFAGTAKTQTPELLWIIAFVGSFSDTLSINLLQKMVGRFQATEIGGLTDSVPVEQGDGSEKPNK